jgi:hypothetical protein
MKLLDILKYTRCHGSSTEAMFINNFLIPKINTLGYKPSMDGAGNIWVEVASKKEAPFLFVAHIDTCHRGEGLIKPIVEGNIIRMNPRDVDKACLGADDGVGIYCNLKMIEAGVQGTYLFTRGEEKGGIGAQFIATTTPYKLEGFLMSVEVDRAGTDEVIVSQAGGGCASEDFGDRLCELLGMGHTTSHMGVYTDVSEFACNIPENVNISAGYYRQHTLKETVDTNYVDLIVERMIAVDWSSLPIKRDKGDYSFPAQSWNNYAPVSSSWEDMLDYVQQYPEKVANYLFNVGVDEYEIDSEWAGDVIEDVEIRHGMW